MASQQQELVQGQEDMQSDPVLPPQALSQQQDQRQRSVLSSTPLFHPQPSAALSMSGSASVAALASVTGNSNTSDYSLGSYSMLRASFPSFPVAPSSSSSSASSSATIVVDNTITVPPTFADTNSNNKTPFAAATTAAAPAASSSSSSSTTLTSATEALELSPFDVDRNETPPSSGKRRRLLDPRSLPSPPPMDTTTAITPVALRSPYAHHLPMAPLTPRLDDSDMEDMDKAISTELVSSHPIASKLLSEFNSISEERVREALLREILLSCRLPQLHYVSRLIQPFLQRDFINILPSEIALSILSHLNFRSLCRAAQVSKRWHKLATDESLWRRLCLEQEYYLDMNSTTSNANASSVDLVPTSASSRKHPSTWRRWYQRQHVIRKNWADGRCNLAVLESHDRHVITSLQFDDDFLVTGSDDHTAKIWNMSTKASLQQIRGHNGGIWALQYRGNLLVTGSCDKTIRVWDMRTGETVHELVGHSSTVRCLQLHKEEKNLLVSGSRDKTLRVWQLDTGVCRYTLSGHTDSVRCLEISGNIVVSGSYDKTVRMWDLKTGEHLRTLRGHTDKVYTVVFDGVRVVSGSLDSTIRVWDAKDGTCLHELTGHQSLVGLLQLRGDLLVSGAADKKLRLWDLTTGKVRHGFDQCEEQHTGFITCLQFDDHKLVSGSDDGKVKLWDIKTGKFVRNILEGMDIIWRLQFTDCKLVVAAQQKHQAQISVWDFDDNRF